MIPPEIETWILPEMAEDDEDVPLFELPCGNISLKFIIGTPSGGQEDLTWDQFNSWDVPLSTLCEPAGVNGFSYNEWPEIEEGVYENTDDCWVSFVMAPASIAEHNSVSGRHVIYIVDERTAILTGDACKAGLELIKSRLADGLADAAMVINKDWCTWSRFDLE